MYRLSGLCKPVIILLTMLCLVGCSDDDLGQDTMLLSSDFYKFENIVFEPRFSTSPGLSKSQSDNNDYYLFG